ncbi:glycosyltransferase family 2 protein [Aerococcus agrisoli]|nr:glycosyltransferase [Aerococcus agrisoli]
MKFGRRLLVLITTITSTIYIIWRLTSTLPFGFGWFAWFCAVFLISVELMGYFEMIVHFYQLSNPLVLKNLPVIPDKDYPHVDIFISTYNEPEDLLYKTINGCLNMEYPDKSKVHIYLCDDGHRESMGELARKMGVTHLVRDTHQDAKAGNLNFAMSVTTSPYIVTFDADMIPRRQFLLRTIPYFVENEKIGFIQIPQTFYNPDLFQFNLFAEKSIPSEQDYFYRDVQVMRNKSNSVIYGGTNTILSREALEAAGGFFTGVITEDFATGMKIQAAGYESYAIDEPLAVGMAPEDLKSLISQRKRWARGCIQTGKRIHILFMKGFSWAQKVSYLTSITYWFGPLKQLSYVMAPILYVFFNVIIVKTTLLQVLMFWLPMYLFNNYTLKKLSGNIRVTRLTYVYDMILFPSLLPAVIMETIGISQRTFQVTRKDGKDKIAGSDRDYRIRAAIPHVILAILSFIGICLAVRQTFLQPTEAYIIIVFWLLVNLYNLMMSIFFMMGRQTSRKFDRFFAEEDCLITFDNQVIRAKTFDLSEQGVAVRLPFPEWIPTDEDVHLQIKTPYYDSKLTGRVVNVFEIGDAWHFAFMVDADTEDDYADYMQIIYDRQHTLPLFIGKDYSSLATLVANVKGHLVTTKHFSRKLPQMVVNRRVKTNLGQEAVIQDFNYQFVTLDFTDNTRLPREIILEDGGFQFICQRKEMISNENLGVYEITNYQELVHHPKFQSLIQSWLVIQKEQVAETNEFRHELNQYLTQAKRIS